jgi:hypothetical protein
MSRAYRILALLTLAAMPASSSFLAASSARAGGNTLAPAQGTHNGAAKAGTANAKAGSGPASVSLPHGQPVLGAGRTSAKPAATLPRAHPQGLANPAGKGLTAAPIGTASSQATAGHVVSSGVATNASAARVQTTTRPGAGVGAGALGVAPGVGARRTAAELNGTAISPKAMATGKINPGAKMVGSINGTLMGRKN